MLFCDYTRKFVFEREVPPGWTSIRNGKILQDSDREGRDSFVLDFDREGEVLKTSCVGL